MKTILYRSVMLTVVAALFAIAGIAWAFGPENPEEAMQRGWARAQAGHFEAAARDFSEVLRTHPRAANARLLRGCCLAGLGRPEAAIADFNECLLLNGDNAAAWHDRGLAYQALGDWKQAAHDFDMALQLNPNLARTRAALNHIKSEGNDRKSDLADSVDFTPSSKPESL